MELTARDIMAGDFGTIRPDAPVKEAVRLIYRGKVRKTGYKPFGIVVTTEEGWPVGMLSMFDILYHLRPPFMNYEVESFTAWEGELEPYIDHFKNLKVEQIMSTPVITVSPEDHLMVVIDRMVKKRARRMPVVKNNQIIGMVYLSDVYYHLCKTWLNTEDA